MSDEAAAVAANHLSALTKLAHEASQGSREALEALLSDDTFRLKAKIISVRIFKAMPSAAYRDAEDLEQDLYNRVIEKIHTFEQGKAAIQTWVSWLARNIQIDHLRRQKLSDETKNSWESTRLVDPHARAALNAAVRRLPKR